MRSWCSATDVALPERVQHALRYAPACALVALIVPEVVLQSGTLALNLSNPKLIATVVTVAVIAVHPPRSRRDRARHAGLHSGARVVGARRTRDFRRVNDCVDARHGGQTHSDSTIVAVATSAAAVRNAVVASRANQIQPKTAEAGNSSRPLVR